MSQEVLASLVEDAPSRRSFAFAIAFIVVGAMVLGAAGVSAFAVYQHLSVSRGW